MTDIDEFEAAEKAAMAKAERIYKAIVYTVGLTVGVAVIAILNATRTLRVDDVV